jgi:glycosyltransferase involved in cell wall biosynthesis
VRVLIDTTYAQRAPYSGTAVYLNGICAALDTAELIPATNPRRRSPAGGGVGSVRNVLADLRFAALTLPRLARSQGADLIHHPLPAHAPRAGVPQVVTVHDLAFERLPECFDRGFRTYAHLVYRAAARRAAAVICVSGTTAEEVGALWDVEPGRIVVAPHGAGQELPLEPAQQPRHFLYVGDSEPRKNLPTLLDAYARYRERASNPLDLVLAGSATADAPGVRLEVHPGPARLAALYAAAVALVHPSLYEGFGLTPLEAMRAGVPVIAAASVREVCGDAARYADPHDSESFAQAMTELAGDQQRRHELAERGRRRAGTFSWDACARAHLDAYSLALKTSG